MLPWRISSSERPALSHGEGRFTARYYQGGDLATWLEKFPPSVRELPTQIRLLRDLLVGLASLHSVRARSCHSDGPVWLSSQRAKVWSFVDRGKWRTAISSRRTCS